MTSESSFQASAFPVAVSSAVPLSASSAVSTFDEVADELYANPPHVFAMLRAKRAEEVRAAGAGDVAARIDKLRVPSVAAWLSNQLVRYFRDEVLVLLDLGRALQVATGTLDRDALRRLDDRRRDVFGELHGRAAWLALEERVTAGRPALRGLGDSLHSAMCSERIAQELLAGRLVRSLPRISWPGLTSDSFPDALAHRRALRVARGVADRASRYRTEEEEYEDEFDSDAAPLASVTSLPTRTLG